MKRILLLALLSAITPAMAQADKPKAVLPSAKVPAAKPQIAPEVLALFDKAAFSYSGLVSYSGDARIEIQNFDGDQQLSAVTTGDFFYARRGRLIFNGKVEAQLGKSEKRRGVTTFKSDGNRFQMTQTGADGQVETSPILALDKNSKADPAWQNAPLDSLSPLLIAGINDLRETKDPLICEMLPPKIENGETFEGARLIASEGELKGLEVVVYFDAKYHLLRDLSLSIEVEGKPTKVRTVYSNLKFNPPIALNMFKMN